MKQVQHVLAKHLPEKLDKIVVVPLGGALMNVLVSKV
jgi:hypothetical protein